MPLVTGIRGTAAALVAATLLASCASAPIDPLRLDEATFEREVVRRFQYGPPEPIPPLLDDPRAGQAADAAYFAAYPDLDRSYAPAARKNAQQLAARLKADAPQLSREQFVLRVAEIAALADNAHTAPDVVAFWKDTPRLPLRGYLFSDGLRVLRAKAPVEDLVGARIDRIDGRTVDELFRALAKYHAGPDARRRQLLTAVLESPALLEAAGLARERRALTISGILLDGTPFERRIEAEERGPAAPIANTCRLLFPPAAGRTPEGMTAWLPLPSPPISIADGSRLFTSARLPDGALYFALGHNNDGDEEKIAPFLESILAEIDRTRPSSLVVDLRFDRGGDYTKTWAFAKGLPSRLPPDARIWLLTSSWTFSAGITTAAALVEAGKGRVRIVGEPVGDRLEFWAEGGMMPLPNIRLQVYYAAGKHDYRRPCDDVDACFWLNALFPVRVDSLDPHVRAPWSFDDYRAGRDPALEVVKRESRIGR